MKYLVTNDDGIDAPGLRAMEAALDGLGQAIVLAPDQHLSGCGHQTTTHRPLELIELGLARHALNGMPADCTRVALMHLAPDVEWVFSGINEGGNLGADVYSSGTVAAVREGALHGRPGIAISQYRKSRAPVRWEVASQWSRNVIADLLARPLLPGQFWNVNLPDLDGEAMPSVVFSQLDPNPLPVSYEPREGRLHYRASYQSRARQLGHDVDVCFGGRIAVTLLTVLGEPTPRPSA